MVPSCSKNCIFSLGTGYGDITYNSRRSILGAVPLNEKISYHLFNVGSNASKTKDIVKLLRKSKWHSQQSNHQHDRYIEFTIYSLEKVITGLDLNPTGEYVVIIDWKGVCLISDVSTNNYTFHKEVRSEGNLIPWNFFSAHEK